MWLKLAEKDEASFNTFRINQSVCDLEKRFSSEESQATLF